MKPINGPADLYWNYRIKKIIRSNKERGVIKRLGQAAHSSQDYSIVPPLRQIDMVSLLLTMWSGFSIYLFSARIPWEITAYRVRQHRINECCSGRERWFPTRSGYLFLLKANDRTEFKFSVQETQVAQQMPISKKRRRLSIWLCWKMLNWKSISCYANNIMGTTPSANAGDSLKLNIIKALIQYRAGCAKWLKCGAGKLNFINCGYRQRYWNRRNL